MMRFGLILGAGLVAGSLASADTGLTAKEKQALRQQIASCWNVGALSAKAQKTPVTVTFGLDRAGKPLRDTVTLVGADKDTSDAVKDAYAAAQRAILRCGAKGYKLPLEKFDQWRNIEITFDPGRMSLR